MTCRYPFRYSWQIFPAYTDFFAIPMCHKYKNNYKNIQLHNYDNVIWPTCNITIIIITYFQLVYGFAFFYQVCQLCIFGDSSACCVGITHGIVLAIHVLELHWSQVVSFCVFNTLPAWRLGWDFLIMMLGTWSKQLQRGIASDPSNL